MYLPVIPLDRRYYLHETSETFHTAGVYSESTTRYAIAGKARLRAGDIARTYAYCWLFAPEFVGVPIITWLSHADGITAALGGGGWGLAVVIVTFLTWLLGSIFALTMLQLRYRKRWAPLREARMTG